MKLKIGIVLALTVIVSSGVTMLIANTSDTREAPVNARNSFGVKIMSLEEHAATFPPEERREIINHISEEIELIKLNKPKDVNDEYMSLPSKKDLISLDSVSNIIGWKIGEPIYLPEGARLRGAAPEPYGQPEGSVLYYDVGDKALVVEKRKPLRSMTIFIKEKLKEKIGNHQAIYQQIKTKSGKIWGEISWTDGENVYGVYGNIAKSELVKVAESL